MEVQSKLNSLIKQGESLVPFVMGYFLSLGGEHSMDLSIPIFDIDYTKNPFKRHLIQVLIEKFGKMVWVDVMPIDIFTGIENILSAKILRTNLEAIRVFSEN